MLTPPAPRGCCWLGRRVNTLTPLLRSWPTQQRLDLQRGHLDAVLVDVAALAEPALHHDRVAPAQGPAAVLAQGAPGVHGVPLGLAVDPLLRSCAGSGAACRRSGSWPRPGLPPDAGSRRRRRCPAGSPSSRCIIVSPRRGAYVTRTESIRAGTDSGPARAGWLWTTVRGGPPVDDSWRQLPLLQGLGAARRGPRRTPPAPPRSAATTSSSATSCTAPRRRSSAAPARRRAVALTRNRHTRASSNPARPRRAAAGSAAR